LEGFSSKVKESRSKLSIFLAANPFLAPVVKVGLLLVNVTAVLVVLVLDLSITILLEKGSEEFFSSLGAS